MQHEVTFARWVGKLLGIVFFYLFLLIGTSLIVFAMHTVLSSLLGRRRARKSTCSKRSDSRRSVPPSVSWAECSAAPSREHWA